MEMSGQSVKFSVTRNAPVQQIKRPQPTQYVDASACEVRMQIGIFFDGTGNNLYLHEGKKAHSNVARLYNTYIHSPESGSYAIYVPGLGTPFPSIGEETESRLGSAFAQGGDSRIVFALLRVFDSIHKSLFHTEMFDPSLRKALCNPSPSKADEKQLQKVGLATSLVDGDVRSRCGNYLSICAQSIQKKAQVIRAPRICECALDVFGFSRGATEARVFCHWLSDLLSSSGIAGVPLRFRFLGLMDTVASVGIWEGVKNNQTRRTGGHGSWATPEVMKILPSFENCLHLVAMHELRKNFPLDSVVFNRELPSNCTEFVYPGSHSDVGGGYAPGELGVSADDSLKLSQIPLNHMYECAVAAGVPMSKANIAPDSKTFEVHHTLLAAFAQFIEILTDAPRSLGDWMLPYLAWRWQTRLLYAKTGQSTKANSEDRGYLLAANQQFCWGDEQLVAYGAHSKMEKRKERPYDRDGSRVTLLELEPEAPELRTRIMAQHHTPPALAAFFDNYVHDSIAGFRKQLVEPTGHWRYRRVFRGSETPYIG